MEEKQLAMERQISRTAQTQTASTGRERVSSRHYKHITKEARRQGEARELLEGMVRRAERKLLEEQKKSHAAQVQSAEARAEELATELFHRPGSLLTEEEVAIMVEESGCIPRREFEEVVNCFTPTFTRYRRIDGTCNNLDNPFLGAADTALVRLIPSQYEDGISSLRGDIQNKEGSIFDTTAFQPPNPSARHVSQTVVRNVTMNEDLTHILMQWGQFIDHDLSLSPELEGDCAEMAHDCEFSDVCRPIRVTDRDPVFGLYTSNNGTCIAFSRSLSVCSNPTLPIVTGFTPREQINVLTSFIDGSMIYGPDTELASKLRKFSGGLLREGAGQSGKKAELPRISTTDNEREDGGVFVGCPNGGTLGCFLAGDLRVNEQTALTIMHTIWLREHNRIARELATLNPTWTDERLYQEARRIVGAIIQKITYYDYLPLILGINVYNIVVGDYTGYDPRINPGVTNAFSTAAYRYGHTLIRPFFDRLGSGYIPVTLGPISLLEMFFDPDSYRNSLGTDPILRGMVSQNSRRVDEFMNAILTNNLFNVHLDLASLNIQRGRDHGLPPYLTWQRYCQRVFPMLDMTDFTNTLTLVRFLEVYGSLDTVDLWIGGLAEDRLPGSLLGPTFACLFGITFANIRDGDRFYYKAEGVFEPSQVASIEQHTLSRVICDNSDNIDEIQTDAFRSDLPRVPCANIPSIDLTLWQEQICFYRLVVVSPPRLFSINIRSFSATSTVPITPFSTTVSTDTQFLCIPFICPAEGPTAIAFFIQFSDLLVNLLELWPNVDIPPSVVDGDLLYQGVWPRPLFGEDGTGLFAASKKICEQSSDATFTLRFLSLPPVTGPPQSTRPTRAPVTLPPQSTHPTLSSVQLVEVDPDIVEQLNQVTDDATSPETDETIPEVLRPFFMQDFGEGKSQGVREGLEVPEAEEGTVSDAQLMSDLEDALRSLDL